MRSSMNVKASQKGFTLIELVVVIVILGILAVTAAPKFINLQSDARTATLQAVKASMQSAATIIHSKSLIAGNEDKASDGVTGAVKVVVNGVDTSINYGYPLGDYTAAIVAVNAGDWDDLLEIAADFSSVVIDGKYYVYPKDVPAPSDPIVATDNCYVAYTQATVNALPTYVVTDCI
jgi:MSHA pilin protein MshA